MVKKYPSKPSPPGETLRGNSDKKLVTGPEKKKRFSNLKDRGEVCILKKMGKNNKLIYMKGLELENNSMERGAEVTTNSKNN